MIAPRTEDRELPNATRSPTSFIKIINSKKSKIVQTVNTVCEWKRIKREKDIEEEERASKFKVQDQGRAQE